jgi:hypothetical protein
MMADRKEQGGSNDDREALDRALERRTEDLAGDIESNRNLSGSSTYETLREAGDLDVAEGDSSGGAGGSRDRSRRDSSGDGMR